MESALLGYFLEFGKSFLQIVATLLPIMNPPSGAAMFLSVTEGASAKTRHALANSISRNCFLMLIIFILLGSVVLKFFGISKDIVLIGGGLLVVKMGWGLVNADSSTPKHDEQLADSYTPEKIQQTAFFPLSFPMTVGPGTLAVCITVGASFAGSTVSITVARLLGGLLGIISLAIIVRVCYGYAEKLMDMLGETGAVVFLRIAAFILLCLGIQLIWNGMASAITELYHQMIIPLASSTNPPVAPPMPAPAAQ
ncbi:hypothetical protein CUZ56_01699 [Saezia sanguinis]|uniref:UPF0056 membrane protein n=1 Tax=Saezia sanguinis TaxID=1965230 RepID=A0A433SE47_9BURK|nr:MarC family protein [Saezia sanguinis]RUS66904.1 hypothetical protein CUZ56_01699 [Saezia sanguinis]